MQINIQRVWMRGYVPLEEIVLAGFGWEAWTRTGQSDRPLFHSLHRGYQAGIGVNGRPLPPFPFRP
jgi:hypothetical protein